ncbi:alpha/beta hydrolase family protein [Natrononativus amylolyticus]|uniref:alpha/beta hydrolase family protein n=1 Tax=Natrononativus amylolyticus TaxID=2963434 RepID=UPI0020CCD76B|nr:prolyl oligopeptidase family serine peptidase [Natrononativus amylolyticus]
MDGFDSHVDGYYDVENQLPRYLKARAEERFEAERARKAAIETVDDHERHAAEMREAFLEGLGGLPEQRPPLSAETTATLERDGYAIETVVFESLPDFHVTGNLYRPTRDDGESEDTDSGEGAEATDGPHPAVLFLCGHAAVGKAAGGYQQACLDLVRNGFVVFAIDPIGQGERMQSYDPETGEIPRQNTTEHTYLGQQCAAAESNLARYFVHDMIRALDYLEARPDVDESRLGATGNSGGGMQTGFLMLVDDRLEAAVPCCFVTSRESYMETGQAQDGEQIVYGAIERGLNYDDFVSAFAPKPALIGAAQSDFLCIDGARQSLERARAVYGLYDRPENVDMAVADRTHGLSPPLREAMVNWFREHLRGLEPDFETGDPAVEDVADLRCTAAGQVHGEYADETHVVDLTRAFVERRHDDAGTPPAVDDPAAYAEAMRETVIDELDLERPRCELHPRRIEREEDEERGVRWEKTFFYSEPGVVVTGIAAVALESPDTVVPTVVLPDRGTNEFERYEERLAALARERGAAMAFDPRGVGAVRARDVNTPQSNGGEYFDYHGTEYKLGSDALMLGESLFGMRVFDVLRARAYLERRVADSDVLPADADGYGLEGVGLGALHAVYAAVANPAFETVRLENLPDSFYEIATSHEYEIDFRRRVHGLVGSCDLPQLLAVLEDRDLETVE